MSPTYRASRLERTRIAIARFLFLWNPGRWLALKLVPNDHPWFTFYRSAWDNIQLATERTLHPRPTPERKRHNHALAWVVLYLAVADFVTVLPGLGLVDPDPIQPAVWLGFADEPVNPPNLPEMIGL